MTRQLVVCAAPCGASSLSAFRTLKAGQRRKGTQANSARLGNEVNVNDRIEQMKRTELQAAAVGRGAGRTAMWARIIRALLVAAQDGGWSGTSPELLDRLRLCVSGPLPVAGDLTKQLRLLASHLRWDGLEVTVTAGRVHRIEVTLREGGFERR
jgi:hypothetical protein